MAAVAAGIAPAVAGRASDEVQYWRDMAALLDPDCYQYVIGTGWTRTVPAGKVWYLLNAWGLRKPGNPFQSYKWHHRDLDTREALLLPSGFTLQGDSINAHSYAYFADPSLVQAGDARYLEDPKGLYFERLARLRTLPLHMVGVHRPVGTTLAAANPERLNYFPAGHDRILLRHVDCHDGCWVILQSGNLDTITNGMNTQDELDDVRPMRLTRTVFAPILRSVHSAIRLGHASITGDMNQPQTYDGWGSVHYNVLPSDW